MTAPASSRRLLAALTALLCVSSLLVILDRPAAAALPAPIMRGYVPLEANATRETMANAKSDAGTVLDFTVGITNAAAGAVMYYDHWEDGFETDVTARAQSTTQVWGDSDTGNGNAADAAVCGTICAGDKLPAGAVMVLRQNIATPRNAAEIRADGGDRVASTRGFTITAGGFTTTIGSLLSASASAYDTTKWGQDYWIPIGQGMTFPSGTTNPFTTASIQVMADQPDTDVQVDKDADGTYETNQRIAAGKVLFVDGGVEQGARVLSNKPVQVHLGAGDPTAPSGQYELRWYTLFPTPQLSADYLNPVGSGHTNQRTMTYLFNPNSGPITVTPICASGCSGTISVPPKGGKTFASPLNQGVRFQSTGGQPFVAVGAVGSESGASPNDGEDNTPYYDWGFSLVPTGQLTTRALLGWAPGNSAKPPSSEGPDNFDDDPVWISALGDTTIYVDYDGNPLTGANTVPSGCGTAKYDAKYTVNASQSLPIYDPNDGDMTGAGIFTCGTKIAGAWGQDPLKAPTASPGFDAGYTLIPSTSILVEKTAGLAQDVNGDGRYGPGDTIAYEVAISDAGPTAFTNLQMKDPVPAGTGYVAGSTTFDNGSGAVPFADDGVGVGATPYPFDEDGAQVPTIQPGQTGRVRYQVVIADPFPAGAAPLRNVVNIDGEEEDPTDEVVVPLVSSDLSLEKVVDPPAPTYLGEDAVFRLVLKNDGPDAATNVKVRDVLPTGLEFKSATASDGGSYDKVTGVWTVGDVPNGGQRTLAVTAKVNVLEAINTAEIVSAGVADPDSTPGNDSTGEDDDALAVVKVKPVADLSLTKTIIDGPDASSNTTFALILTNAGPGTSDGVAVSEYPPPAAMFVSAEPKRSSPLDGTFANGVWTVPDLAPGTSATMHVKYRTPVANEINFVQVTTSEVFDPDSQPGTDPLTPIVNPPNQDDEAQARIPAVGDLRLSNKVTTAPAFVGDTVTYTVTVKNEGPTDTTDVNVVDKLPTGLQFVEAQPSAGTYNPSTGVWTIGPMANGAEQTLVITARVLQPGTINTTAEVTSSTADDVDSAPNNHVPTEDDQEDAPITTTGASLGDTVWFDTDLDFVKDPGEPGLEGVTVTAVWAGPNGTAGDADDQTFTTTTGAGGVWSMTGLPHGRYSVTVDGGTLPNGITTASQDRDGKDTAHTTNLELPGSANLADVDFAYAGSGFIGDVVFLDTNRNGEPDAGEGIPGVTLTLKWFGPDGAPGTADDITYTTQTDTEGRYEFPNLPSGRFSVETLTDQLPEGLKVSVDPEGPDDGRAVVELDPGEERLDIDFGYVGTNSIGDRVFADVNGDGLQQAGEPGLGGVTVTLAQDADGDGTYETTVDSVATAGNGSYLFDQLPAGKYRAVVTTPAGLELTTPEKVARTVGTNETFLEADFGLTPPLAARTGAIGDLVWDDQNGNGVPDPGERGLPGVTVTLWRTGGPVGEKDTVVAAQTTGADGSYEFANLPPGSYRVTVTPPPGYSPTTPLGLPVPLSSGATVGTADFGLGKGTIPPGTIGDRVWSDTNGDGVQDPGEPGLTDIELTLRRDKDGDGVYETVVGTTKTDGEGAYAFKDVPPGAYRVVAKPPTGKLPSVPTVAAVDLVAGQTVDSADFGFATGTEVPPSAIGDRVWLDTDRDGVQDPDEPGVNDVTVILRSDPDGDGVFDKVVETTKTSGDGNYGFPDLPPGVYLVVVTPPAGLAPTVPPILVPLLAGQNVLTADVGLARPASDPFDLQVVKAAESTPLDGEDMTWLFAVSNNGIAPSPDDMTVTDTLPDGLTYRSASGHGWKCSASGRKVTCDGTGPLAPGATSTFKIVTRVDLDAGKQILNGAEVNAEGNELTKDNNDSQAGVVVGTPPPTIPAGEPSSPLTPAPAPPTEVLPDRLEQSPAPAIPPTATLPLTGSDIASWLRFASGLMLAGVSLLTAAARRRCRG